MNIIAAGLNDVIIPFASFHVSGIAVNPIMLFNSGGDYVPCALLRPRVPDKNLAHRLWKAAKLFLWYFPQCFAVLRALLILKTVPGFAFMIFFLSACVCVSFVIDIAAEFSEANTRRWRLNMG